MKFRGVEGGTPVGPPLCRTCHEAMYVKGKAEGQELLYCKGISYSWPRLLPFEAYECSEYSDKRQPSKGDFYRTAWIIQSDMLTKKIGFIAPSNKVEHKKILQEEGYD